MGSSARMVMTPVTQLPVFHPCEVSQVEGDLLAVFFPGEAKRQI